MRLSFAVVCLAMLFAVPAYAASQCYAPAEMEAEQLLRLHSELMVITVTCHTDSQGANLVPYYTGFTKANIKVLHDAEQTLIRHYKAVYGGNGIDRLDKLRTKLANEYGQMIADVSAPKFCAERRDVPVNMYNGTPELMAAQLQYLNETAEPYENSCTSETHVAKKGK